MNDILKIGIMWILLSIPFIYFCKASFIKNFIVVNIGIVLTIIGFIINEYQAYKWEKTIKS